MSGVITDLFVYPIKGLSGQPLREVELEPGCGFPGDRAFALARPDGQYVPGQRQALPKEQFFMLAKNERLAGLRTRLAPGASQATVSVREHEVLSTDLKTSGGTAAFEQLFARVLDLPEGQRPLLAHDPPHRFTDVSVVSEKLMNAVSVINLESVRDLERRSGQQIDPRRFRANVYVDGLPPFSELTLVTEPFQRGAEVRLGDISATAVLNTRRCAATEVNPATARRDLPLPRLLMEHYGHTEIGVYVSLTSGGLLRPGDRVTW